MPPRSQALAPGTDASRDATSPAVTPSAVANVRRFALNNAATASCRSSSSTPNTSSPSRSRMVRSTGSIWASASARVAARARMRSEIVASPTVMPTSGTWPRRVRSSSFSSTADSPAPKALILRCTSTPPARPERQPAAA